MNVVFVDDVAVVCVVTHWWSTSPSHGIIRRASNVAAAALFFNFKLKESTATIKEKIKRNCSCCWFPLSGWRHYYSNFLVRCFTRDTAYTV